MPDPITVGIIGTAALFGLAGYAEHKYLGTSHVKDTTAAAARAAITTGTQGFTHRFLQRSADAAADVLYGTQSDHRSKRDTIFLQQWKRGRTANYRGRARAQYRPMRNRRYQQRRWARKYPYQAWRRKRTIQRMSKFRQAFAHLRNSRFYYS